ncbi:MAG: hypothetical protein ACXV5H_04725 [Halobacteriota archaeon]
MKRMTLIAATLCLVLLATVGAGLVTAKQQANPRQAGSSSVYFYDVAATDTHGTGKLIVNVDKHTFEFNGQGFDPSVQIALRARAAGSTDYIVFATGKATPSGNLHIAGTWEAAAPVEVVGGSYYPPLYSFYLHNIGGFVAKVACDYSTDGGVTWHRSGHTDGTAIWTYKMAYLDDLGVPADALVKIHVIVVGGIGGASGKTGSEVFQHFGYAYDPASCRYADYTISGTIFKNKLEYDGYH